MTNAELDTEEAMELQIAAVLTAGFAHGSSIQQLAIDYGLHCRTVERVIQGECLRMLEQ